MKNTVLYIHGKGGSAEEAEHYKTLFKGCDVIGLDYKASVPWEAKKEFNALADKMFTKSESLLLIANSIGAYFAMQAFSSDARIEKAFFISPIVNMERLIRDMMTLSGITDQELKNKKIIPTSFGETLSWEYLQYVIKNPIKWDVPTCILYGEKDNITSYKTISDFAYQIGASLTVMKDGEHWFHTKEQMNFLDLWIKSEK